LVFQPRGRGTELARALDYAGRVLRHRAVIFVLSDFLLGAADGDARAARVQDLERTLRLVSARHDVVAIAIRDAAEEALPDVGVLVVVDPETGRDVAIDTGSAAVRALYASHAAQERDAVQRLFRGLGVDEAQVRTDRSYIGPLLSFFRKRDRQRGR